MYSTFQKKSMNWIILRMTGMRWGHMLKLSNFLLIQPDWCCLILWIDQIVMGFNIISLFFQRNLDSIVVYIYVKSIRKDTVDIHFGEKSICVKFQTGYMELTHFFTCLCIQSYLSKLTRVSLFTGIKNFSKCMKNHRKILSSDGELKLCMYSF